MAETNGRNYGVLIIDMQDYFLEKIWWSARRRIKKNQKRVIRFCSETDTPVINITTERRGSTQKEISEALEGVSKVVYLEKYRDDAFTKEDLESQLRYWSINALCIMGLYASACVRSTAISAKRMRFEIVTSSDIIADRRFEAGSNQWYIQNGLYFKKTADLIAHMSSN